MNKTIGEILKGIRKEAGLSQSEMCEGVLSVSAYSKIERGIHKIDIDTLYEILGRNSSIIDVKTFLYELLFNSNGEEGQLYLEINLAFLSKNLKALKELTNEIKNNFTNKQLLNTANLALLSLQQVDIDKVSNNMKSYINKQIMTLRSIEVWNLSSLNQLRMLLPFLESNESNFYLVKIWKNYQKGQKRSLTFLEVYVEALLVYCEILLKRHSSKDSFAQPLKLIDDILMEADFGSLFGFGIKAKKINALINQDSQTYEKISQAEKLIGLILANESDKIEDNPYFGYIK
ncbi:helix-turn-helix transcriptional regulator [Lactobacillus sp.]|uniref:helix-turn-helix domain-containing protein n=1 Tax=Lactobacillus sp. TaxID=1591 RepID=UPI0019C6C768|nr:helix-turn-helix transcriptional regulator [Lactobacillus sp.]MBD5429651.1 helix-turn-helix transcriptional regulator [Lactobacillus sp.]